MGEREELIERLEKATGPNLEMETEIYLAEVADEHVREFCARTVREGAQPSNTVALAALGLKPPAYTASLDAAMTLVPEGRRWSVSGRKPYCAGVERPGRLDALSSGCPTPALALCIAALRALSHSNTKGKGE